MNALHPSRNIQRPTAEMYDAFLEARDERFDLLRELMNDFVISGKHLIGDEYESASRNVVRCFGSFIDALATAMREEAIGICRLFGKPLNGFLQEKAHERSTSLYHRIYTSYRLLSEFMPDSPLARIEDARWNMLAEAIGMRNRIMHPESVADLAVDEADMMNLVRTGVKFCNDIPGYFHWCKEEQQRLLWSTGGSRVRVVPKVGRNDLCPCQSKRKYKNCCGRSRAERSSMGAAGAIKCPERI